MACSKRIDAARKAVGRSIRIGDDERRSTRLLLLAGTSRSRSRSPATRRRRGRRRSRPSSPSCSRFDHPSLTPYAPGELCRDGPRGTLVGGCRRWTFAFPIEQALDSAIAVAASDVVGWPTGGWPASVCVGDKRYVVTLRPLLPGETP